MISKITSLISKIQYNWTDLSQTNLLKPSPNPKPIFTSESCKDDCEDIYGDLIPKQKEGTVLDNEYKFITDYCKKNKGWNTLKDIRDEYSKFTNYRKTQISLISKYRIESLGDNCDVSDKGLRFRTEQRKPRRYILRFD